MRETWDATIIAALMALSKRSQDAQSQYGCMIVDRQHTPLGMGFNGFARDLPDSKIPNVRPAKYPWAIHAEENALYHALPKGSLENTVAYITGWPCFRCSNRLWHNGVRYWKILDNRATLLEGEVDLLTQFYEYTNAYIAPSEEMTFDPFKDEIPKNCLTIEKIKPNMTFLVDLVSDINRAGYIHPEAWKDLLTDTLDGY